MDEHHHVNKENNLHYNIPKYIMTLGSHCSLQVLKGAKDEGFRTLLICENRRLGLYKRFKFIDEMFIVEKFEDFIDHSCQEHLMRTNSIIIPHGTLVAYMDLNKIENILPPIFGNKRILRWEADRKLKEILMLESHLSTPKTLKSKNDI